jgi:hypothetical protein
LGKEVRDVLSAALDLAPELCYPRYAGIIKTREAESVRHVAILRALLIAMSLIGGWRLQKPREV